MVDKEISIYKDMEKFVDINMKKLGANDPVTAMMMIAGRLGIHGFDQDDEYLQGISSGLIMANMIIEYYERKVN